MGIFGKPLNRAIWNTLGLHAVLTMCLRFSSVWDTTCVACCLFLSKGGALSAVQAQCNYLGVWLYERPILCDTRGIIVV